jgi:hypothetical protein
MTKQYRINTTNMHPTGPDDCVLAPTDPVHELTASSIMGGLGSAARLGQYNELTHQEQASKYLKQRIDAQAQGIKPGSPAWYAMFPKH